MPKKIIEKPQENDLTKEQVIDNPPTQEPEKETLNEGENKLATTMDALTEDENFPEVKENAIQAVNDQKKAEKEEAQKLEAAGVKLNKDGSVSKQRGRKAGSTNKNKFINPDEIAQPQNVSPSLQSAIVISGVLEQMSVTLISDDFKLETHEKESNIIAWAQCLDHYGGLQISPPAALVMNHAAIILARANKEKTITKMGLFKAWVKNKIANYKGRKNAFINSRKDDVGQDNIRKEESPQS